MTTRQYGFFVKQISTLNTSKLGDYTFNIKHRYEDIYELEQIYKGSLVILYVGSKSECIDAAKDCVQMIMGIE